VKNTPLGRSADVWFRANEWVEHLFGNPDEDVTSL
jgi:hypothetical protein